ncbi:MAG: tetratricopeptide repeat protein [Bacteroidia bacterium]
MKRPLLVIFFLILKMLPGFSQQQKIDSLRLELQKHTADSSRVNLLNELGGRLILKGNYPEARNYLSESRSLSEKLNFKKGISTSLNYLGTIYQRQNNHPEALECYNRALKILDEIDDKSGIANLKSNIGIVYSDEGNYEEALEEYMDACRIRESIKDTFGYASSEINIGNIFFLQNNYAKSREYYMKSLKTMQLLNRKYEEALLLNNIGLIYSAEKDYPTSLDYFFRSLKVTTEIEDKEGIANAYSVIGEVYAKQKFYTQSLEYYTKAVGILRELGNKRYLSETYGLMGIVYDSLNDPQKAMDYFSKQLSLASEIGNKKNISNGYLNLSNQYKKSGDYKKAYNYYLLYSAVNDSLFNETNTKLISEMEAKYQNEKKQKEITQLTNENELKQLRINRDRNKIIAFIFGALLLLIAGFVFYQRTQIRNRQKLNAEILKQKELRTKAIIDAQEGEQIRIAKDLHDGVGQLLTGLKLNWENITSELGTSDEKISGKIRSSGKILDEAASEVRTISHQMMPRTLSESGLVAAIEGMLNSTLKYSSIQYDFEHSNVSGRFSKEIELTIFRVTQELINNILKHSGATTITIQLFRNKNQLVLLVEDNGKGFKFDELKVKGLGLMNITTRIKLINGEVNYEQGPFNGSITTIRVPIQ